MQDLQFWFRKARLNIRIVNVYKRISGINNPNVFSMTIDRTKKKRENSLEYIVDMKIIK